VPSVQARNMLNRFHAALSVNSVDAFHCSGVRDFSKARGSSRASPGIAPRDFLGSRFVVVATDHPGILIESARTAVPGAPRISRMRKPPTISVIRKVSQNFPHRPSVWCRTLAQFRSRHGFDQLAQVFSPFRLAPPEGACLPCAQQFAEYIAAGVFFHFDRLPSGLHVHVVCLRAGLLALKFRPRPGFHVVQQRLLPCSIPDVAQENPQPENLRHKGCPARATKLIFAAIALSVALPCTAPPGL
jgi:hypothetical protein